MHIGPFASPDPLKEPARIWIKAVQNRNGTIIRINMVP